MVTNQQSKHRSQGTVRGMKLLLLSRGHISSKDRLFGGDQTIPEQLLQGAGQSGMGTRQISFRKQQANRLGFVAPRAIGATETTAPALPSTAVAQSCANALGSCASELGTPPETPSTKPQPAMWCLLILDKGTGWWGITSFGWLTWI